VVQVGMAERKRVSDSGFDDDVRDRCLEHPTGCQPLRVIEMAVEGAPVVLLPLCVEPLERGLRG
jgi:hypothetical protein